MKDTYTLILGIIFLFVSFLSKSQEPYKFKHMLSAEEENSTKSLGKSFIETDPPVQNARNIAEFESMNGVLVRYPFGIPLTLIKSLAEKDTVITIVANSNEEATVINQYTSQGIDLNKCKFIHIPTDSYWTRDYGPVFTVDGNDKVGVVNFIYNRPRPNDDNAAMAVADYLNMKWYGMKVVHTGGNYMADGYGIAASTKIVYTESADEGISQEDVDARMLQYLGIQKYHVLDDPNNTYIDHIDCWGKFLDVDKILIRSVPESHAQYNEIEEMAEYWKNQKSSWGNNYEVYRVYTPNDQPYSNSLILNGRVFVPQMNSSWDDDALEVYRQAMPGYEVIGFTGDWLSTDALHCRTHEIADKHMLQILHMPLLNRQEFAETYSFSADIKDFSKEGLYTDSLKLIYRVNEADWVETKLENSNESIYMADISGLEEGVKVEYYIHAADSSGRSENNPYMGKQDPHMFYAGGEDPYLTLSHKEITFDDAEPVEFVISNTFPQSAAILKVNSDDLKYSQVSPKNELEFPYELKTDGTVSFDISPLIACKDSKGYNTDTLKIETADSTYQLIIHTNESLLQDIGDLSRIHSRVYPNPFNDKLNIEISELNGTKYRSAHIVDITGRIVQILEPINQDSSNVEFEWNTEVAKGIYFVNIIFDTGVKSMKVIKQ